MANIIKYINGVPKERKEEIKEFNKFREKYGLEKEIIEIWKYSGPLIQKDFDTILKIFYNSDLQFIHDKEKFLIKLERVLNREEPLTKTTKYTQRNAIRLNPKKIPRKDLIGKILHLNKKIPQYKDKKIKNIEEIPFENGPYLFDELKRIITEKGIPYYPSSMESFIKNDAKQKGIFNPISYSYPLGETKTHTSLSTDTLVFINEKLEGKVNLLKRWPDNFDDILYGNILIDVLGKETEISLTTHFYVFEEIDSKIRREILEENEGVNFYRIH